MYRKLFGGGMGGGGGVQALTGALSSWIVHCCKRALALRNFGRDLVKNCDCLITVFFCT